MACPVSEPRQGGNNQRSTALRLNIFEAKKMIVSQLIRRVDVYRGYQIHVDFNFDLAQYLENSDELAY